MGTIEGDPKWIDSDLGPALKFDGKDDYLEIPAQRYRQRWERMISPYWHG